LHSCSFVPLVASLVLADWSEIIAFASAEAEPTTLPISTSFIHAVDSRPTNPFDLPNDSSLQNVSPPRHPHLVQPVLAKRVSSAGADLANKVRAVLTTIGIVIGVASVTAVIAALTGLKENVLAEFESFGTNKIFINPSVPEGRRRCGGPTFGLSLSYLTRFWSIALRSNRSHARPMTSSPSRSAVGRSRTWM